MAGRERHALVVLPEAYRANRPHALVFAFHGRTNDNVRARRYFKPQPDGTLVKAFARAWRWQRLLDDGAYGSVSEISDAENISKSYVSRILRLALLAPDIVEAILAGSTDQGIMLQELERPLPASWKEQRGRLLSARTS